MSKEEILSYVKGFYETYRQTKNGLFIYSGIKIKIKNEILNIYTYISNEEIGKKHTIEFIKDKLNFYIEEVVRFEN